MALDAGASGGSSKGNKKKWKNEPKTPTFNAAAGATAGAGASTSSGSSSTGYANTAAGASAGATAGSSGTSYASPSYFSPPSTPSSPRVPVKTPSLLEITQQFQKQNEKRREKLDKAQDSRVTSNFGDLLSNLKDSIDVSAKAVKTGELPPTGLEQLLGQTQDKKALNRQDVLNRATDSHFMPDEELNRAQLAQLRSLNNAAPGTEIPLPERFKHVRNNKNKALSWWWDKDLVDTELGRYEAVGDDFMYEVTLDKIMDRRYKDKENFAYFRTNQRGREIEALIREAEEGLRYSEGDPSDYDVLDKALAENPEALTPLKFREDYGITQETVRAERDVLIAKLDLSTIEGQEKAADIQRQYDTKIETYGDIQQQYQKKNKWINDAIKRFEIKYNTRVEADPYVDAEDVGPAIPEAVSSVPEGQDVIDFAAADKFSFMLLGRKGAEKLRDRKRKDIQNELGLKKLPNTQQMLAMMVQQGMVNPEDEDAVDAAIARLSNPAHPDAKGVYARIAMAKDPDFTEEDALEFINRDYKKWVETLEQKTAERAVNGQIDERIENAEDWMEVDGVGDFFSDVYNVTTKSKILKGFEGDTLAPAALTEEEKRYWYGQTDGVFHDYINKGEDNAVGSGLWWTLDKIARFAYANAGAADAFRELDKDKQRSWSEVGLDHLFIGKNPMEMIDEIVADPVGSAKAVGQGYYGQMFRGSGLPGVPEDVTPFTLSHVLSESAAEDGRKTILDNKAVQIGMGLFGDIVMDPTTYVGVGLIANTSKIGYRGAGALTRGAIDSPAIAREQLARWTFGSAAGDALKAQRIAKREMMTKGNWLSRMHNPRKGSRAADASWRVRWAINPGERLDGLGNDVPYENAMDLKPIKDDPTVRDIVREIDTLAIKQDAVFNDIAVNGIRQHMEDYVEDSARYIASPGYGDLRIEALLANIPKGFLYQTIEGAKNAAKSKGFLSLKSQGGDAGAAAARAQREIDELTSRIEGTPSPAFQARLDELQKTVNEGQWVDKNDLDEFFAAGNELPDTVKDQLLGAYSKAVGVPVSKLSFTDQELFESITKGLGSLRATDRDFRTSMDKYYSMLENSKTVMERSPVGSSAYNKAQGSFNVARDEIDHAVGSASIHYLEHLEDMGRLTALADDSGRVARVMENPVYRDQELGEHLTYLNAEVTKAMTRTQDDFSGGGVPTGSGLDEPAQVNDWLDYDFSDANAVDLVDDADFNELRKIKNAIDSQLKAQRLDTPDGLKGVRPLAATRLKATAPPRFLDSTGKLDKAKLQEAFSVERVAEGTKYERWKVEYKKGSDYTPSETAFLRNVGKTLQDYYNDIYVDLNLQYKAEVTGIGVETKAKKVFEPGKDQPFHAVVLGTKDNEKLYNALAKRGAKRAKSVVADTGSFDPALGSSARNTKLIHDAIKKADEDGIPPVVFMLDSDQYLDKMVDYARTRGVTVYSYRNVNGKPKLAILNDASKAPKAEEVFNKADGVKSKYPNSGWGRKHPEGIKSPSDLMSRALESGEFEDFLNTLFLAGAPFNLTDRTLLQVDDMLKRYMDDADKTSRAVEAKFPEPRGKKQGDLNPDEPTTTERFADDVNSEHTKRFENVSHAILPPTRLTYKGKVLDDNLAKARSYLESKIGKPAARAEIEKFAEGWFDYVRVLPPEIQTKLFHDIYEGALLSAEREFKRLKGQSKVKARRSKSYADKQRDLVTLPANSITKSAYAEMREGAMNAAISKVVDDIETRASLPSTVHNKRMRTKLNMTDDELRESAGKLYPQAMKKHPRRTVNESVRDMIREVKAQHKIDRAEIEMQAFMTQNKAERVQLVEQAKALDAKLQKQLKQVEVARKEALLTKKYLRRDAVSDALIQATFFNGKNYTESQLRQLIAAKRIELETAANRLNEPEIAAKATAHRWYNVRRQMLAHKMDELDSKISRPSRQLETDEARNILALMTGVAPILVQHGLKTISKRMGGMMKESRKGAFQSIRLGEVYRGPQIEFYDGVKAEMDYIESIFNGTNKDYQFALEGRPNATSFVTLNDLQHWLPQSFMPDWKALSKARRKNKNGNLTIGDIFDAIPKNRLNKEAYDPAVFAHTVRIAAGQAREARIAMDSINKTFGVPRAAIFEEYDTIFKNAEVKGTRLSRESQDVEQLKQLGWETIPELGNTHYFHPEAVGEIKRLVSLINKQDARTNVGKAFDSAISSWKGLQTTYSPAYYTRNIIGETLMAWIGGVSNPMYYKRSAQAMRWLKHEDVDLADLVTKLPGLDKVVPVNVADGKGLAATLKGGQRVTFEDAWRLYGQRGLKSTFTNQEIRAHGARVGAAGLFSDRKAVRKVKQGFNKLHDAGEGMEDYVRFAHFMHALEHSGRGSMEAAADYAAKRVRRYHFDYTDVSDFEKVVIGRVFPFYKWTKFAAPVMLSHMFLKPGRITAPIKAMDAFSDGLNSDDLHEDKNGFLPNYEGMAPPWVRDLFSYQMSGATGADDEYADYIRISTPQIDSLAAVWQPQNSSLALMNPAIKAYLELSANRSLDPEFADMPIRGGEFNERYNISDLEATGMYASKMLGPFGNIASKTWRGAQEDDEGNSYADYRESQGYDKWRELFNATGISMYQAKPENEDYLPQTANDLFDEINPPAVGHSSVPSSDGLSGRKAALEASDNGTGKLEEVLKKLQSGDEKGKSGWKDFDNEQGSGWQNFGSGGYGGGGYYGGSSGYSFSSGEWNNTLMELLRTLRASIDQGDVTE